MRILLNKDPFKPGKPASQNAWGWQKRGLWPCHWVSHPGVLPTPMVAAYRLKFEMPQDAVVRAHSSADERYELYLDGVRIGRGSERGDPDHWYFESWDIPLSKGPHVLVARVWSAGLFSPFAQRSLRHGFLFASDNLSTGKALWESKLLGGVKFLENHLGWGTGGRFEIDGSAFDWGFEKGLGEGWQAAIPLDYGEGCDAENRNEHGPTHKMLPARLPAMLEEKRNVGRVLRVESGSINAWQAFVEGKADLQIAPNASVSVLIDLENYYCAYHELLLSGGASSQIEILWAESLFNEAEGKTKGDRNAFEGKHFIGFGDTFKPDGGSDRLFEPLWWQAGRFIKISVKTASQPLRLRRFQIRETRYPFEMESRFRSSDPRLERFIPIGLRGLQMCSHETYMDCPYYEQLMYAGDTRLEALTTYTLTHDSRLPRKAIELFAASRLVSGLTQSRYPSRVTQVIPPFSLWWIGMLHDFALWRGEPDFVHAQMPVLRSVLDAFLGFLNPQGMIQAPVGWNFMDWVGTWPGGIPPEGEFGVNALINWQLVGILEKAAQLEDWLGEGELATRWRRHSKELAERLGANFWVQKKGLFSEDLKHKHYSEHTQCLALLSGHLDARRKAAISKSLPQAKGLDPCTIYFSHYLFESYAQLGRMDKLFERLELWFEHEKLGLKTTMEAPEPTRSDCHAWGAHPLYHYFTSILGIRPASMGFESVIIRPQLGSLDRASGKMVHPKGFIEAEFEIKKGKLSGSIKLPKGLSGTLQLAGKTKELKAGKQLV